MIGHPIAKHLRYLLNGTRGNYPSFLFYYLTLRCNSRCGYCHVPNVSDASDANCEDVIKNLKTAATMGITHLFLTGGEPLLYRNLDFVLRTAQYLGFHLTLTTNGLSYPDHAERMVGLVDNLEFSLPAADPQIYAIERGVDGYHRVIQAINLAIDLGERPAVSATITDDNFSEIPSLIKLTEELGVMLLLKPAFRYFGNRGLSTQRARDLLRHKGVKNAWYNEAFVDFFLSGGNHTISPRCKAMTSTIAISPDDGLYLPCFHKVQEEMPILGDLKEAMRSPKIQAYREGRGRWEFCQGCTVICYFEDSFVWPVGRLFLKDLRSRIRWLRRWRQYH